MSERESKTSFYYEIEIGECYCYCRTFVINGINAEYEDFGEKYDRDSEHASPYCCKDMKFTPHTDREKIAECLDKYGITIEQFNEIVEVLSKGLSFGECGWCE